MFQARHGKAILVRAEKDIGMLFKLSKLVSDKGVNILAISGAASGEEYVICLVTDDNLRTKDALAAAGYSPYEESVVLLELSHKPSMFKRIAETLAREEIEILHVFATALAAQERSLVVLHSSNDAHALVKLNETKTNKREMTKR